MPGRGRTSESKASVVIADANTAVITSLSHALELRGIDTLASFTSMDELAESDHVRNADAILLHFNMPDMKVAEILPALRDLGLPVIVMSGDETNLDRSMDAGADAFFYKDPRNIAGLAKTILEVSGRPS